jgi:galactokinase
MSVLKLIEKSFEKNFGEKPLLVRSPGRVNLIGEHTDYNQGFVLPAAIDKAVTFAIAPRSDRTCNIIALDMHEEHQFILDNLQKTSKGWPHYLMGVVDQLLQSHFHLSGFNCVFGSTIPIGAGLSSSAAIEAGLAFTLNKLFDLHADNLTLVKLAQRAENEFVGVRCGIMDQFINIFGEKQKVLQIDCRSLEYNYYPFEYPNVSIVLFNTGVSHSLASSEYNKRREQCGAGVETIKRRHPHVTSLRDVSLSMLEESKSDFDPLIYRRCKYVVEENDRLLKGCDELERGDLKLFGSLMYQTHEGLSHEYEVSCKELDFLVATVRDIPQVYGARMMGGGFGGCTINLIENQSVDEISKFVAEKYKKEFSIDLKTYVSSIDSGTHIITESEYATG